MRYMSIERKRNSGKNHGSSRAIIDENRRLRNQPISCQYQGICKILSNSINLLSGNEILTSIKGNKSVINLCNLTTNNPNLDVVNINAHAKLGQMPSICSQDIERKRNSDINQGS